MVAEFEGGSLVEVNFLCVHKKLRSKRLAPVRAPLFEVLEIQVALPLLLTRACGRLHCCPQVLIKEITRRVNRRGLFQATYTAGVVLPKPVAKCRYWHRSLNPKKLIEVGFSRLAPRMTLTRTIKLYQLPEQPQARATFFGRCSTRCATGR